MNHIYPNILIVDDDEVDRELFIRLFKKINVACHVNLFKCGQSVLNYLSCQENTADCQPYLIFLDVYTPPYNNLKIYEQISQLKKAGHYQVYLMTSTFNNNWRRNSDKNYVSKEMLLDIDHVFYPLIQRFIEHSY